MDLSAAALRYNAFSALDPFFFKNFLFSIFSLKNFLFSIFNLSYRLKNFFSIFSLSYVLKKLLLFSVGLGLRNIIFSQPLCSSKNSSSAKNQHQLQHLQLQIRPFFLKSPARLKNKSIFLNSAFSTYPFFFKNFFSIFSRVSRQKLRRGLRWVKLQPSLLDYC